MFHIYRTATNVRAIVSGVLFYQFVSCVAFIAFSLFAVDRNLSAFDLDALICVLTLFAALFPTFIYCYHAEKITRHLQEIGNVFYHTNWYELPVKVQKLYVLSILIAQKPFRFRGYGIVVCSLEIFGSVKRYYAQLFFLERRKLLSFSLFLFYSWSNRRFHTILFYANLNEHNGRTNSQARELPGHTI